MYFEKISLDLEEEKEVWDAINLLAPEFYIEILAHSV
jgi:hypothetical protein